MSSASSSEPSSSEPAGMRGGEPLNNPRTTGAGTTGTRVENTGSGSTSYETASGTGSEIESMTVVSMTGEDHAMGANPRARGATPRPGTTGGETASMTGENHRSGTPGAGAIGTIGTIGETPVTSGTPGAVGDPGDFHTVSVATRLNCVILGDATTTRWCIAQIDILAKYVPNAS